MPAQKRRSTESICGLDVAYKNNTVKTLRQLALRPNRICGLFASLEHRVTERSQLPNFLLRLLSFNYKLNQEKAIEFAG